MRTRLRIRYNCKFPSRGWTRSKPVRGLTFRDRLAPTKKPDPINQPVEKTCKTCGLTKSITEFYQHKSMRDGHLSVCRSCKADYAKSWAENNRDARRVIVQRWNVNNKDKSR